MEEVLKGLISVLFFQASPEFVQEKKKRRRKKKLFLKFSFKCSGSFLIGCFTYLNTFTCSASIT